MTVLLLRDREFLKRCGSVLDFFRARWRLPTIQDPCDGDFSEDGSCWGSSRLVVLRREAIDDKSMWPKVLAHELFHYDMYVERRAARPKRDDLSRFHAQFDVLLDWQFDERVLNGSLEHKYKFEELLVDRAAELLLDQLGYAGSYRARDPNYELADSYVLVMMKKAAALLGFFLQQTRKAGSPETPLENQEWEKFRSTLKILLDKFRLAELAALSFMAPHVTIPGVLWPEGEAAGRDVREAVEGLQPYLAYKITQELIERAQDGIGPLAQYALPMWDFAWPYTHLVSPETCEDMARIKGMNKREWHLRMLTDLEEFRLRLEGVCSGISLDDPAYVRFNRH